MQCRREWRHMGGCRQARRTGTRRGTQGRCKRPQGYTCRRCKGCNRYRERGRHAGNGSAQKWWMLAGKMRSKGKGRFLCWFGGRQGVSQVLVGTNGIGDLIERGDVYWIVADVQKAGDAL